MWLSAVSVLVECDELADGVCRTNGRSPQAVGGRHEFDEVCLNLEIAEATNTVSEMDPGVQRLWLMVGV